MFLVTIASNVLGDDFDTLAETIPGVAGDDYPIFAEVPESSFLCDGQVGQTHKEIKLYDTDQRKCSWFLNFNPFSYNVTSSWHIFRPMEDTMQIWKPNVKLSTSVPVMGKAASPSTASSVLMELSSTRTTSYVTGGSTWTALSPKAFMRGTWKSKLKDYNTKAKWQTDKDKSDDNQF